MTPDERTLLLLAAEALRSCTSEAVSENVTKILADALDRIAGAGKERVMVLEDCEGDDPRFGPEPPLPWETTTLDPRFTPNSGKCWRCGVDTSGTLCYSCLARFERQRQPGMTTYDATVRAWIEAEEAEERGKP